MSWLWVNGVFFFFGRVDNFYVFCMIIDELMGVLFWWASVECVTKDDFRPTSDFATKYSRCTSIIHARKDSNVWGQCIYSLRSITLHSQGPTPSCGRPPYF